MLRSANGHKSDSTRKEAPDSQEPGNDRRIDPRSREDQEGRRYMQTRGNQPSAVCQVAEQVQGSRHCCDARDETRSEGQESGARRRATRKQAIDDGPMRGIDRAAALKKKRELGLHGNLKGRHLSFELRRTLLGIIDHAQAAGEPLAAICAVLEINPRAVYRWRNTPRDAGHGGGGGLNKVTEREIKRVVKLAEKFPQFRCRRLAYSLERSGSAYIGKTKVAEILKANGLGHEFARGKAKPDIPPDDYLKYEPWRRNLVWGADWTWVHVEGSFMYLLVVLDWYSRMILSWGLFPRITSTEVVAVMTSAVAQEEIDLLRDDEMKPRLVLDHGSANVSKYTRQNLEVQGLEIWLSGIGRPTGNARTERVIGTLKHEEIKLQPEYENEDQARTRIDRAIRDYNFRRPNSGNGGFAPQLVHLRGRASLTKRREDGRQKARNMRVNHWKQEGRSRNAELT